MYVDADTVRRRGVVIRTTDVVNLTTIDMRRQLPTGQAGRNVIESAGSRLLTAEPQSTWRDPMLGGFSRPQGSLGWSGSVLGDDERQFWAGRRPVTGQRLLFG